MAAPTSKGIGTGLAQVVDSSSTFKIFAKEKERRELEEQKKREEEAANTGKAKDLMAKLDKEIYEGHTPYFNSLRQDLYKWAVDHADDIKSGNYLGLQQKINEYNTAASSSKAFKSQIKDYEKWKADNIVAGQNFLGQDRIQSALENPFDDEGNPIFSLGSYAKEPDMIDTQEIISKASDWNTGVNFDPVASVYRDDKLKGVVTTKTDTRDPEDVKKFLRSVLTSKDNAIKGEWFWNNKLTKEDRLALKKQGIDNYVEYYIKEMEDSVQMERKQKPSFSKDYKEGNGGGRGISITDGDSYTGNQKTLVGGIVNPRVIVGGKSIEIPRNIAESTLRGLDEKATIEEQNKALFNAMKEYNPDAFKDVNYRDAKIAGFNKDRLYADTPYRLGVEKPIVMGGTVTEGMRDFSSNERIKDTDIKEFRYSGAILAPLDANGSIVTEDTAGEDVVRKSTGGKKGKYNYEWLVEFYYKDSDGKEHRGYRPLLELGKGVDNPLIENQETFDDMMSKKDSYNRRSQKETIFDQSPRSSQSTEDLNIVKDLM